MSYRYAILAFLLCLYPWTGASGSIGGLVSVEPIPNSKQLIKGSDGLGNYTSSKAGTLSVSDNLSTLGRYSRTERQEKPLLLARSWNSNYYGGRSKYSSKYFGRSYGRSGYYGRGGKRLYYRGCYGGYCGKKKYYRSKGYYGRFKSFNRGFGTGKYKSFNRDFGTGKYKYFNRDFGYGRSKYYYKRYTPLKTYKHTYRSGRSRYY